MEVQYTLYAMTSSNVAFVDASDVELVDGGFADKGIFEILYAIL